MLFFFGSGPFPGNPISYAQALGQFMLELIGLKSRKVKNSHPDGLAMMVK
jgi:hypothetical protein